MGLDWICFFSLWLLEMVSARRGKGEGRSCVRWKTDAIMVLWQLFAIVPLSQLGMAPLENKPDCSTAYA